MRETFFTSDTHFGHRGIINLIPRPFTSVDEMDEKLIANWNARVTNNDRVFHLGDFSFHGDKGRTAEIIGSLNGRKHLIRGNHDEGMPAWLLDLFDSVARFDEIRMDGVRISLSHFPALAWNGERTGGWMLHGHSHGSLNEANAGIRRHDVGVDANSGFAPVTFEEIREAMRYER